MNELALLAGADERAQSYIAAIGKRRVFPDSDTIASLASLDEPFPEHGFPASDVLRLLDEKGSPATVASNDPRYFGFVIGASLPGAAADERLMLAWDQCASSFNNSPIAVKIEQIASGWVLEALNLPRESAIGFGTSATACTLVCIAAAGRALLARHNWDLEGDGLTGAPEVRAVISEMAHTTAKKALRVLGFGMKRINVAPTDIHGRT
jgi:glutamate/tyrosine decarboxylase-like PLP-dependent enzyme